MHNDTDIPYILNYKILESSQLLFLAQCSPYCENVLLLELIKLGARNATKHRLGIFFYANLETFYQCALFLRTVRSISLIMKEFDYNDQKLFYKDMINNPWLDHLSVETCFNCEISGLEDKTLSQRALKGIMKDAVKDSFQKLGRLRPMFHDKNFDLLIKVFIQGKQAFLSIVLANNLHKRSWASENKHDSSDILIKKEETVEFSADLAAVILYRAQWPEYAKQGKPFIDGLCGSGVFLTEAYAMAYNLAPQLENQKLGFEKWKPFNPEMWISLRKNAQEQFLENCDNLSTKIYGYDARKKLLEKNKILLQNKLFSDKIVTFTQDFCELQDQESENPGLIVYNIPFSETQVMNNPNQVLQFYEKLGQHLKKFFKGWKMAIILASEDLLRYIDVRSHRINTFLHERKKMYLAQFLLHKKSQTPEIAMHPSIPKFKFYLEKRYKTFNALNKKSWNSEAWRLYNSENPSYRALCEIYDDTLIVRPLSIETPVLDLVRICQKITNIPRINTVIKNYRTQQSHLDNSPQLQRLFEKVISEGPLRFHINLTSHDDTGFDISQRNLRRWIINNTKEQSFLDLFCYTGSLSIAACESGSSTICAVDTSVHYLNIAKHNVSINGQRAKNIQWVHRSVQDFIKHNKTQWDIVCINCPTYSFNSASTNKKMEGNHQFNIYDDHSNLLRNCQSCIHDQSLILFATYSKSFELDSSLSEIFNIQDMTMTYLDEDCQEGRIPHFLWHLTPKQNIK